MADISQAHRLLDRKEPSAALEILGASPAQLPSPNDPDVSTSALAEFYRGIAHSDLKEGALALQCTRRALAVMRPEDVEIGRHGALAAVLSVCTDAGKIEFRWGRRLRAVELAQFVMKAYSAADEGERVQSQPHYSPMMFDSGMIALNLGMPGVGRPLLHEALKSFSAGDDQAGMFRSYVGLAHCEEILEHRELAMQFIRQGQALGVTAPDADDLLLDLIGQISLKDNDLEQARRVLQHLDERHDSLDSGADVTHQALLWADLLRREGRTDEAISRIRSVLVSGNSILRDEDVSRLRFRLAMLLGTIGQLEQAAVEANHALICARASGYEEFNAKIAEFLGGLALLSGDLDTSHEWVMKAVDAAPSLHVQFGGLGFSEFARDHRIPSGSGLLPVTAAASGRPDEALHGLLRLRLDMAQILQGAQQVVTRDSSASLLTTEYDALHLGIDLARSLLRETASVAAEEELTVLIRKLEADLAAVFNEMSRSEIIVTRTFEQRAGGWAQSRPSDAAYVFLYPENYRFLAVVVNAGVTSSVFLDMSINDLEATTEAFWHDVRDIGIKGPKIIEFLSDQLWNPVRHLLTQHDQALPATIEFVPFGWAQLLPLHLLLDADGTPLYERYGIQRAPFIDVPASALKESSSSTVSRLLFVAPDSTGLPGIARERAATARSGFRTEILAGSECTGVNLTEALAKTNFDVIHFAGHANVNYAEPALSYLQLAHGHRFYLADILRYVRCSNAIVFLSACDSAVSGASRVNLRNSLADAFHLCGARTVIGSQWPAEDAVAVGLAEQFYTRLADGLSPTEAFHAGFREVGRQMCNTRLSHRYWAGWSLSSR